MTLTVSAGVTCLLVPRSDWDDGSLENVVLHVLKDALVAGAESVVCDPNHPEAARAWTTYALAGWYGFTRGGNWVLMVRKDHVMGG